MEIMFMDVSSSDTTHLDNIKNRTQVEKFNIEDVLPSNNKPHCISDIDQLNDKVFIEALRKDLLNLPPSPVIKETKLFEKILVPYKYLWNKQYSLAIEAWELLFKIIQDVDANRYKTMHKGTPFYFCGIAAFEGKDYERAVFYFDAALQEDVKNYDKLIKDNPELKDYKDAPAALFLKLDVNIQEQTAIDLTKRTKKLMEDSLKLFNKEAKSDFGLNKLQNYFLEKSLESDNAKWRSAATALLSYVLESETRKKEFSLRSDHGGTMEPFFLHLFKGCLLFETLLKLSGAWVGDEKATLGDVFNCAHIRTCLEINNLRFDEISKKTFSDIVSVYNDWRNQAIPFNERVAWTTYGIRNTTGHNLSWQTNEITDDYQHLSDDILFANFLVLSKLFSTNDIA
jgi:tetratricopeptide (TPR) repeat protein